VFTTITTSVKNKSRLAKLGRKNQSYDKLIGELFDSLRSYSARQ
jgi:hypothetical protein